MIARENSSFDRDERLHQILLDYLEDSAASPGRLLEEHPEFAAELSEFFACLQRLETITAPLRHAFLKGPYS